MQPFDDTFPTPSETLAASQPKFLSNNQTLANLFAREHEDLTDVSGNSVGKHKKVTLLGNLPVPVATASQLVLYDKITSGSSELWMKRDGFATEYQLTSGGYAYTNPTIPNLKASVRFQATTGAISYAYNVSSVAYSAPQNYQINFTTALGSANYYPSIVLETTIVAGKSFFGNSTGRTNAHYGLIVVGASAADFVQVAIFGV